MDKVQSLLLVVCALLFVTGVSVAQQRPTQPQDVVVHVSSADLSPDGRRLTFVVEVRQVTNLAQVRQGEATVLFFSPVPERAALRVDYSVSLLQAGQSASGEILARGTVDYKPGFVDTLELPEWDARHGKLKIDVRVEDSDRWRDVTAQVNEFYKETSGKLLGTAIVWLETERLPFDSRYLSAVYRWF